MKYYAANAHISTNTNSTTPSDKKVFWYSDEDGAAGAWHVQPTRCVSSMRDGQHSKHIYNMRSTKRMCSAEYNDPLRT